MHDTSPNQWSKHLQHSKLFQNCSNRHVLGKEADISGYFHSNANIHQPGLRGTKPFSFAFYQPFVTEPETTMCRTQPQHLMILMHTHVTQKQNGQLRIRPHGHTHACTQTQILAQRSANGKDGYRIMLILCHIYRTISITTSATLEICEAERWSTDSGIWR